jgi:hypothetical protein
MRCFKLFIFFILSSCVWYHHSIVEITNPTNMNIEFDYVVTGDRSTLKGMINKELFTGEIFSKKAIQKAEIHRYPNISKKIIAKQNKYAYARLTGNKGGVVECFIHRSRGRLVTSRMIGRCYFHAKRASFDIFVQQRSIFDGFKSGLKPLVIY